MTLTEFTNECQEITKDDLIRKVGEYKNPMYKPKTIWFSFIQFNKNVPKNDYIYVQVSFLLFLLNKYY